MFIVIQLLIYVKVFEHTVFLKYLLFIANQKFVFAPINNIFKVFKKRDVEKFHIS